MIKRIMLCHLKDGTPPDVLKKAEGLIKATPKEIPGIMRYVWGPNGRPNTPWTHMWDFEFANADAPGVYRAHQYHTQTLAPWFSAANPTRIFDKYEVSHYSAYRSGVRATGVNKLTRRVMLIQLKEGTPKDKVAEWEEMMLQLPKEVPTIGNFSLGRTLPEFSQTGKWTHVWELEFADAPGMLAYDKNRYHIEDVAPFFKPGGPKQLVEAWHMVWTDIDKSFITKP